MVGAALLAGCAYGAYRAASGLAPFVLLTAVGVNGTMYLNAAGSVLVGRIAANGRCGHAYASYRVWGSVGYIVVALVSGLLLTRSEAGNGASLTRTALEPVFLWGPGLFVLIAAVALFVPDRKAEMTGVALGSSPDHEAVESRRRAAMTRFLQAFFLYQFSLYGASAYLSLLMKGLGATPMWITATFAAGVLCEVMVMTRIGHLSDCHGRRPILAVAFILMPLRLLCYIPASTPLWVLLVQLLHGLNFGIMGAIAVVFVNDLAPDRERGAAQARLAGVGGLAVALGPASCGLIAQRLGLGAMFAAMAAVGAVGAALFLARVPEPSTVVRTAYGEAMR
jgi:PPP family 3-phenylpropionic acid transporter